MTRSLPIWTGKTDDTPPPPRVKARIILRQGGICAVKVLPDGTISVTPPKHEDKDEFSDVRMK